MINDLKIKAGGEIDFVSLGALVHRLDPGIIPFRKANECKIHVSGGEFNVAANLSDCFGLKTAVASAMVDYPIGHLIAERVKAMGVIPFYKNFKHNGVTGPNMATVYSDRAHGLRAPSVFYNRANEAAAQLKPGDFNWNEIFEKGVRWFHSGGIFASLSSSTGDLIIEAMKMAKAAGIVTSFDLNYREKLWSIWGGEHKAAGIISRIVEHVDVLFANEYDLQERFGIPPNKLTKKSELDPFVFFDLMEKTIEKYPNLKIVVTGLRQVHTANCHSWSAVAWSRNENSLAPVCELDIYDRVGGGDGFASGFIYGLLSNLSLAESLKIGWAHGALLTTYPGDTTMSALDEVLEFARGGSAIIKR